MSKTLYLRVPDEVHEALLRAAEDHGVSMVRAAELVLRVGLGVPDATMRLWSDVVARWRVPDDTPSPPGTQDAGAGSTVAQ